MIARRNRRVFTYLTIMAAIVTIATAVSCSTITVTEAPTADQRGRRDALLILPGLGDSPRGRRHMRRFGESLQDRGYDVFVPKYRSRDGLQATADAIGEYIDSQHLDEYHALHVFSFILGAWSLNTWIAAGDIPANLTTIIYDRSPLQERAPAIVVESFGGIVRMVFGDVVDDVAETDLPLPSREGIQVGLIIESKATPLLRRHREEALAMGPFEWEASQMDPTAGDAIYLWIDHDEMYISFAEIGPELIQFIEEGRFSMDAERRPFDRDPFEK